MKDILEKLRADREFTYEVDKIFSGQCVLFTGSGFSHGASNILNEAIPTAWRLKELLEEESGLEAETLEQAADDYMDELGDERLARLLKSNFTTKTGSEAHIEAANNSWKRIYTTNYDDVMEWAARKNGTTLTPVTPSFNAEECYDKSNLVIHINGSVHFSR